MKYLLSVLLMTLFLGFSVDVVFATPRRSVKQEAPSPVVSEDVTIDFKELPILDLIRAVYGDILKINFSIDPALVGRVDPVTVTLRDSNKKDVLDYMVSLLNGIGILIEDRRNYLLFKPRPVDFGKEVFVYRPLYRSVSYIQDLLGGLFHVGSFSKKPETVYGVGNSSASKPSTPMGLVDDSSSPAGVVPHGDLVASHKDVDTFVFQGSSAEIARLKSLISLVDIPVGEVNIKAVIFEVGSTKKDGSSIGLAFNILGGKLGLSLGALTAIGDSASIKSASFNAIFSVLSSDSRFRVLSSPSIRVKSGSHGIITVGADVPILSSVTYDAAGKAFQNIRMMSSGVIFDLKPVVTESAVDLEVKQQISNFVPTTTGVSSSPTLLKRDISTVVGTTHDEVIFLGGLIEAKKSEDTSGFSFLPSWSNSGGSDESRSELLLILQVQKLDKKI